MNKRLLYLNSFVFVILVVFAIFINAQAAEKDYVYGSKAQGETSTHYLKKSVQQQEEIIKLLKQINNGSQQKEMVDLLKEIKGLLKKNLKVRSL